jgi:lipopolysaccharide/colanic/teichoic acid biosynthesis glycosyltransferase
LLAPKRRIFFILDFLILILALGSNLFYKEVDRTFNGLFLLAAFFFYVVCLFLSSGFFLNIEPGRRRLTYNLHALLKGIVGANLGILTLIFFFFRPYRDIFFYHAIITGIILFLLLALLRTVEWKYFWRRGPLRVMILGEEPYQHLYLKDILAKWREAGCEIFIALPASSTRDPHRNLSRTVGKCIIRYITTAEARDLLLSGLSLTAVVLGRDPLAAELLELLPYCYQNGYSVMGIGPFYELVCRKVPLFQVGESWLVHTSFQRPSPDLIFLKRAFDILFSILLILLFPLGLLVALAIKLESPGPVLYTHDRSGLNGKTFKMYKFRSMQVHKDDSDRWPHWEGDLVTHVGSFLRSTGLDEIPQLINILKGDMSFVGPRPARPLVTQRHIEKIPFYAIWLAMRPGLTGWAQLHQGTDMGDETVLEKVRYNLYYAKNLSPLFDLEIFLKTIRIALLGRKPRPTREVLGPYLAVNPKNPKEEQ